MVARSRWCKVRHTPSEDLHRIALKLRHDLWDDHGWSDGQEAFFDEVMAELRWRSARSRRGFRRCHCEFCLVDPDECEEMPF